MDDRQIVAVLAALTVALFLVAPAKSVHVPLAEWQHFAERVADELADPGSPSLLSPVPGGCPAVTTLVPIQCPRP